MWEAFSALSPFIGIMLGIVTVYLPLPRDWLERRIYLYRARRTYGKAAMAHIRMRETNRYLVRH